MVPQFITFTGIDDRTDLARLKELSDRFPIEWGLLFTSSNMDARFPSQQTIDELLKLPGKYSAHLCGKVAREFQKGRWLANVTPSLFKRVQVNGFNIDTARFDKFESDHNVKIILQSRSDKFLACKYHQLYDRSGGNGLSPNLIPELPESQFVGYSGGIGPETVIDYLSRIPNQGNSGSCWIDMESNVRTNGWFDLNKVESVCRKVYGSDVVYTTK